MFGVFCRHSHIWTERCPGLLDKWYFFGIIAATGDVHDR